MACINSDGSLTPVAEQVLRALSTMVAGTGDAVARATGLPVYRARGSLRELELAGLVTGTRDAQRLSAAGQARLEALPAQALP